MKIAYFDCFSGISGDMILGALVDAGVPLDRLSRELKKLSVSGYTLSSRTVKRNGLRARKVDVVLKKKIQSMSLKTWKEIESAVLASSLSTDIKTKGLKVYKKILQAESRVHGRKRKSIHLHELGAVDCLVDIFGTIIGLQMLGLTDIHSSPINLGSGVISSDHGVLPVPSPATSEITKNVPVFSSGVTAELTTPTGAALITSLATQFGTMPNMKIHAIGTGAGSRDYPGWPNMLRIFLGKDAVHAGQYQNETITVIETNIDDMNPQVFEHVIEMLYAADALDVYLTQVIMKKGRPGVQMTVLSENERREQLMDCLLKETSTIGLRFYEARRKTLSRKIREVHTAFGKVRVKTSYAGNIKKTSPEYEDLRQIAKKEHIPLVDLMKNIPSPDQSE